MSIQIYSVDRFIGLNQSGDENLMSPACTPDAANMCTDGGELRVAYGFTRLFEAAVPGTLRIDFFTLYRTNGAEIPVVIAGGVVYAYMENAWTPVYTYQSTRSKPIYDCAQVRINTTDYLVIADGQHGMIKFDGSSVTQFGSEENASNIPVSFLTMYRGRLFAAGDAANPDRLYYSVLPGSGRTVEQWGAVEASPAVEGGHVEIGALGGDPIVAVRALSNPCRCCRVRRHAVFRNAERIVLLQRSHCASLCGYALHKSLYGNGGSFRLPHKNRSRQAVFHFSAQRKGRNDRI